MFFIPENIYDVNEIKKYLGYTEGEREKSGTRLFSSMMEMSAEHDLIYNSKADKAEYLDLKNTPIYSIPEMRAIATLRFFNYLEKSGINATDLAREVGNEKTTCARMRTSVKSLPENVLKSNESHVSVPETIKPLSIPNNVLPAVARYAGHTNAHEMLFGTKGRIVLPEVYSAALLGLSFLSSGERDAIENRARTLWDIEKTRYEESLPEDGFSLSAYGQIRTATEILQERFEEISSDAPDIYSAKGCLYSGSAYPHKLYTVLRGVVSGKTPGLEKEAWGNKIEYEPGIKWMMMFSVFTAIDPSLKEKNLDFFLANDYVGVEGGASASASSRVPVTPIFAVRNGVEIEVSEPQTLRILSFLAALPKEVKPEIFSEIFAGIAKNNHEQLSTLLAETMHKPYSL